MVKGLAPQREFLSSRSGGAVRFFQMCELLMRAIYSYINSILKYRNFMNVVSSTEILWRDH